MIIYYTLSGSSHREESHRLLREAIAKYINDSEKAGDLMDEIKTNANGKPYITGFDHFSISHSKKAWAVLFNETECGLDVQYERKCDVLSVARRWYNPIDADSVASAIALNEEAGTKAFFRLWARREALVKALGETVFDEALPSVEKDSVSIGEQKYILMDIDIFDEEEIHAAICFRKKEYKDSNGSSGVISCKPYAYNLRST